MENIALSKRERQVLLALVKSYVAIGEPVASRTLGKCEDLGISPATIRSTLAQLEEKGYVKQPHTSAGRVPADRAYRFYVEQCMPDEDLLPEGEDAELQWSLEAKLREGNIDAILGQLAKVVGDISQQLGLVMAPRFELGTFHKMELLQLTERRLLLVVTINQGLVKSLTIEVDSRVSREDLELVSRLLNERLHGLTMAELRRSVRERLQSLEVGNPQLLRVVTEEIEGLSQPSSADLHVAGTSNICLQPEFHDPFKVAGLMNLVERKDILVHLLQDREGMVITIGEENIPRAMRVCSMVTASYEVGGMVGVLGVIGPTRMPYSRVVALVNYAASRAADLVS
jgi:heat-inducible transcriptional repressor